MTTMQIDRAVVEQALEALELEMDTRRCKVAIAALAEPVQEDA